MEYNLSAPEYWVILGFLAVLFEMLFVPGLGILFIGLGAITIAGSISWYPEIIHYQYPLFALFSFLWFGMLWQPLKKYLYNKPTTKNTSDVIGNDVEVIGSPLRPSGGLGQVKWSGTIMNARLDPDVTEPQEVGTTLRVKDVDGTILILHKP
jgi:membrane protein implicated in regulation of membrane protease activity